jgi:hypothetical protein
MVITTCPVFSDGTRVERGVGEEATIVAAGEATTLVDEPEEGLAPDASKQALNPRRAIMKNSPMGAIVSRICRISDLSFLDCLSRQNQRSPILPTT